MKKRSFLPLTLLAFLLFNCASAPKFDDGIDGKFETQDYNFACSQTGARDSGVQCLRTAATNSTKDKAFELAKKYAVAAVLLRGVSGQQSAVREPLMSLEEQGKNRKFIEDFFNSGDYLKYLDQASIEPQEVYKVKGGYRVGITAKVNYERMMKALPGGNQFKL